MDAVFRALADPTRRLLLDRLREHNGQTLGELCARLEMARQSATQHLDILVRANLVVVVRRGTGAAPLPQPGTDPRDRGALDRGVRQAASASDQRHQEPRRGVRHDNAPTSVPTYVYVTYIRASAEQVWHALTDADLTARYWGHANVSDWQPGSTWEHRRVDGSGLVEIVGRVLEAEPPTRLVITFEKPGDEPPGGPSVVTFLVEPHDGIVRLTVTHENLADQAMLSGISYGWPAVLANLKSLLETGDVLTPPPYEMSPPTV